MPRRSGLLVRVFSTSISAGLWGLASVLATSPALAAVTVEQALKLTPVQKDVEYDRPTTPAELAKCTIKAEKTGGKTGWIIRDGNGRPLRNFVDTNADNVVDLWCYFKDGIEVYRDIDANFNGKADQCRWLNTAGTRWGMLASDDGKDSRIEFWKMISAEEVTAEFVAAVRDADSQRFERLLISPKELQKLGLGTAKTADVSRRIDGAKAAFKDLVKQQKSVGPKTRWTYFGATRPGIVPAGADGAEADVMVYENVYVMIDTDGKAGQMPIGTLVRSQDAWRLIDTPSAAEADDRGGIVMRPDGEFGRQASDEIQKLMADLEKLDKEPVGATSAEQISQNSRRADIIEKLAAATDGEQRIEWLKQLSDSISAGSQAGAYPEGVARLKALFDRVREEEKNQELAAYVQYRFMTAEYGENVRSDRDYVRIQAKWLVDLQEFCTANASTVDGAEAMLQLANGLELAGEEGKAMEWYDRLLKLSPGSPPGLKAKGAMARLDSVGKNLNLHGKGLDGKMVELAKYRGKVVLVHYWAAEYTACQTDMPLLQAIQAKYAPGGFAIVSLSLDNDPQKLTGYFRQNRPQWEQIYEGGGLDSRLANELGILTLPTMILLDKQGRVVNRNIHAAELDAELAKMNLLSPPAAKAKP